VIEALSNPSGDHMDVYIQLGVAVAILLGSLYYLFGRNKSDGVILTLDEAGTPSEENPNKSKRAKVVRKTQGQQSSREDAIRN
jgi:hypothetical protein